MSQPHLLPVVALLQDMSEKGLRRGQVGTVVEVLGGGACLVEFSDDQAVATRWKPFLPICYSNSTTNRRAR